MFFCDSIILFVAGVDVGLLQQLEDLVLLLRRTREDLQKGGIAAGGLLAKLFDVVPLSLGAGKD